MSNRSKGMKAEREIEKKLLKEGYLVYRVKGSTRFNKNVDIFGEFDMLAVSKLEKYWVQVKCNKKLYKPKIEQLAEFYGKGFKMDDIIVWCNKIDRKGWDIKLLCHPSIDENLPQTQKRIREFIKI